MNEITEERKLLLDGMFEAFSLAADGTYVYVCDMLHDLSRWSENAVDFFDLPGEYMYQAGSVWESHIHPDDVKIYHESIDCIFKGISGTHDLQYRARDKNGDYVVCTCRGKVLKRGDTPEYFMGVIKNHGIYGHMDELTGIRNQFGFFEDINEKVTRQTPFNVLLLSLSHFYHINSVFGYDFGNKVIKEFARLLAGSVGDRGLLYRMNGVKFALISTEYGIESFIEQYDKLREYLSEGFVIDDKRLVLETSIGAMRIDEFPVSTKTIHSCLCYALNTSKEFKQGDFQVFENHLNYGNGNRIDMLNSIRESIINDCNGFMLYYQPIVDAKTEKLKGAEALIRWHSDKYGVVPPNDFINVLENDAFFLTLADWILKRALLDSKIFIEHYPDFIINVNISYAQIKKADFVNTVNKFLDQTGFPAKNLCLELTERCRFLDMSHLSSVILSLKQMGVHVALDDFGTGFSSVEILKTLPFNTIKIDRDFVKNIETDEKEYELLSHFAGIASLYGTDICVEGIENTGMRDLVRSKSVVSTFQGYFYSKPLPYDEFVRKYINPQ